jgi:hypothetical protein
MYRISGVPSRTQGRLKNSRRRVCVGEGGRDDEAEAVGDVVCMEDDDWAREGEGAETRESGGDGPADEGRMRRTAGWCAVLTFSIMRSRHCSSALTDGYARALPSSWLAASGSRYGRRTGRADETRWSRVDGRESLEQPLREEHWAVVDHPCGGAVAEKLRKSINAMQRQRQQGGREHASTGTSMGSCSLSPRLPTIRRGCTVAQAVEEGACSARGSNDRRRAIDDLLEGSDTVSLAGDAWSGSRPGARQLRDGDSQLATNKMHTLNNGTYRQMAVYLWIIKVPIQYAFVTRFGRMPRSQRTKRRWPRRSRSSRSSSLPSAFRLPHPLSYSFRIRSLLHSVSPSPHPPFLARSFPVIMRTQSAFAALCL